MNPINSELDRVGDELCEIRHLMPQTGGGGDAPPAPPSIEDHVKRSQNAPPLPSDPAKKEESAGKDVGDNKPKAYNDLTIVIPKSLGVDYEYFADKSPDCTVKAKELNKQIVGSFRALICKCKIADGKPSFSITVRGDIKQKEQRPDQIEWGYKFKPAKPDPSKPFAFDTNTSGMALARACFDCESGGNYFAMYPGLEDESIKMEIPEGLILIAGSTGAAKSQIARAMIAWYLGTPRFSDNLKRRPHLLTLENPIEKYFYPDDTLKDLDGEKLAENIESLAQAHFVDCTHRTVGPGQDVESLEMALSHAKRQTPAVVYVGEVRSSREWRAVIDFAATGHLIITTGHASSLSEAMNKIFAEAGATNPAARGRLASRIRAVIHLETQKAEINGREKDVLLPKVWRSVRAAAAKLVADGLGSLIPGEYEVLGRKDMVERLFQAHQAVGETYNAEAEQTLLSLATQHDLKGI